MQLGGDLLDRLCDLLPLPRMLAKEEGLLEQYSQASKQANAKASTRVRGVYMLFFEKKELSSVLKHCLFGEEKQL